MRYILFLILRVFPTGVMYRNSLFLNWGKVFFIVIRLSAVTISFLFLEQVIFFGSVPSTNQRSHIRLLYSVK